MPIQDFFSCVYHSQRQISDRLATNVVIEAIKECVLPGKELEAGQLIEKGRNDLAKTEVDFILIRSELFADFGIDIEKFIDSPNPVDKIINQLQLYATRKGFFYEQSYMLAIYLGLHVQTQLQMRDSIVKSNDKGLTDALSQLNDRIRYLIPVLTGANAETLISEFNLMASESNKSSIKQHEFFVDKVCSSLMFQENSGNSQKSNSSKIHISGNVSGSTIIVGNENEVQSSKKKE
jgi:hypothetical protein